MADSDPYYVVRDDVSESLVKTTKLLNDLVALKHSGGNSAALISLTRDLTNSVRSIEWDLEDLEETIKIVEQAPQTFNLTPSNVSERKQFVSSTRKKIAQINQQKNKGSQSSSSHGDEKKSLLHGRPSESSQYSSADANAQFVEETKQQQQLLLRAQDEQIDNIGASVKVLKNISNHIGNELEDQSLLLDDFGHEMETTNSKMDDTMKKIAKVTRMSSDKKQWCAIGVLVLMLIVIIILFAVLK